MLSTAMSSPACELCSDSGWRPTSGDTERRVTRCECRTSDLKLRATLPPLLCGARLSDFAGPLLDAGRRWLDRPTSGLLLTGPVGTGKTWFAAALVRALVESGRKATFKAAADLFLDLRSGFANTDSSEFLVLNQFVHVPFFVLDDLASGSLSDFERRSALHVLDRRLNYSRPTVVTTNLSVEQIGQLMDSRIGSRIGGYTRIAMTGRDRRQKTLRVEP